MNVMGLFRRAKCRSFIPEMERYAGSVAERSRKIEGALKEGIRPGGVGACSSHRICLGPMAECAAV